MHKIVYNFVIGGCNYIVRFCNIVAMKTELLQTRVEPDLKKDLKAMAKEERRGLSDYIRIKLWDLVNEYKAKKGKKK